MAENDLLRYDIFGVHTGRFGFRLTPAFVLYMVSRHRLSPHFLPGVPAEDKIQIQRSFLNKFVDLCVDAVHVGFTLFIMLKRCPVCHVKHRDFIYLLSMILRFSKNSGYFAYKFLEIIEC